LRKAQDLIEGLAIGAVDEALENQRTIPASGESARRVRQIVAHDIEFRELCLLGEIRLVRVDHTDLASLDRQNLGCVILHHCIRLTLNIGAKPLQLENSSQSI
jgi:hypothetical protein